MIISSIVLFLTGFGLLIYAGHLQSEGYSDALFNLMGALFFIIMILILVLFLSHEEQLSTYHEKKKEERLHKGMLSYCVKDDTKSLIIKRLEFYDFYETKNEFMLHKKIDRLFGNTDFYVKVNEINDFESSIKETLQQFKDVRIEGPSYGRSVKNCVLILTIVDHLNVNEISRFKEIIEHYIALEQFGDVFIPFIYEKSTKRYIFRNVKKNIQFNRFYVGTEEFKKYIMGHSIKIHQMIKHQDTYKNEKGELIC